MRGRKPKPIAQQIAEGDPRKRGVHKLDAKLAAEPKATRGLPSCPRHLKGRARSAWTFWAEELAAMGIDRRPDAQMLEGACVNYARAVQADLEIQRDGITVKESYVDAESGEVTVLKIRKHPAVEVANAAWLRLHKFASEFGLSPVSRLRLATEKPEQPVDDFMEMLSRPRAPRPPPPVN